MTIRLMNPTVARDVKPGDNLLCPDLDDTIREFAIQLRKR